MISIVILFCLMSDPTCDEATAVKAARPDATFFSTESCREHAPIIVRELFDMLTDLHDGRVYKVSATCVSEQRPA